MRTLITIAGWLLAAGALEGCAASTGEIGGLLRLADGTPAPGAAVLINEVPRDSVRGGTQVLTWADGCGRYRVPHLRVGRYVVDASGRFEAAAPSDTVTLRAGDHTVVDRIVTKQALAKGDKQHVRACE